jgi:copper/silver efflux system protein
MSRWSQWSLRWKWLVMAGAVALVAVTVPVYQGLGSEFMPPLDEGARCCSCPPRCRDFGGEAGRLLQVQDRILMLPGSGARAGQSGPRRNVHRSGAAFDDGNGHCAQAEIAVAARGDLVRPTGRSGSSRCAGASRRITFRPTQLVDEMNGACSSPAFERLDHAHQESHRHADHRRAHAGGRSRFSVRPGCGSSASGGDRTRAAAVSGTRSVFAERVSGGYFLDFDLKRDQLARYGLSVDDARRW